MKKGFTLIELSISIAFIAILSILVVLIINNAVSAYHRGLTLNQLNTTGMDLVDDMRAAVQMSSGKSLVGECAEVYETGDALTKCQADGAASFVSIERYANVEIGGVSAGEQPVYGAFCTGAYSYVWNSGYLFNAEEYTVGVGQAGLRWKYLESGDVTRAKTHDWMYGKLLKIKDANRAVCKAAAGGSKGTYLVQYDSANPGADARSKLEPKAFDLTCEGVASDQQLVDICGAVEEDAIDILASNSGLAFYDLTTAVPAESASVGNMFYAVSFVLGTVQGGINVKAVGNYCEAPEGYNTDVENFDYCAINKFNFAAQATGG